jgi:hypothetical protein
MSESEIQDLTESSQRYIKSVIEGLDLGDGEFLLAVAWVTEDAKRYHEMYPYVLGFDVVFGTNQEKRPHMRGTGKSSSNKNLPIINAFLPSQQKWVYDWFINDALPDLLFRATLKRTKVITSDQDKDFTTVIDLAIKSMDSLFGNASRRICKWHKVSVMLLIT